MKIRIIERYDLKERINYYALQYKSLLSFGWRNLNHKKDLNIIYKDWVYYENYFKRYDDAELFAKKRFMEGKKVWIAERTDKPKVVKVLRKNDFDK